MSVEHDTQRGDLLLRKGAIETARKDALVSIRATLDAFAEKIGAPREEADAAMGGVHDMLSDISYEVLTGLDCELEELDIEIERKERPDPPIVL